MWRGKRPRRCDIKDPPYVWESAEISNTDSKARVSFQTEVPSTAFKLLTDLDEWGNDVIVHLQAWDKDNIFEDLGCCSLTTTTLDSTAEVYDKMFGPQGLPFSQEIREEIEEEFSSDHNLVPIPESGRAADNFPISRVIECKTFGLTTDGDGVVKYSSDVTESVYPTSGYAVPTYESYKFYELDAQPRECAGFEFSLQRS